jgi:hypothetical protein
MSVELSHCLAAVVDERKLGVNVSAEKLLDVQTYDAAETEASDKLCNRINQAFYPEMFASLGYPMRVKCADQLWRYIDVMHETRTHYNMVHLLKGLTAHEFELFKRVTEIVDCHAKDHYGQRGNPTAALLRAMHVLRLIKIVTGDERPTVLEVGPGCGYLAMLLVMEGYPYVGTDVAQAFYLYQSHMLSRVARNLRELVVEDEDILSLRQPEPGTAVHIPWWKWVTMTPEKVGLAAGIMTSNHCLCEMHPSSMAYLSVIGRHILSNHPGGGKFVFDSWGYNLLHGEGIVLSKFMDHGFRLVHNETAASAMMLADRVNGWNVYGVNSTIAVPVEKKRIVAMLNEHPQLKRLLLAVFNRLPSLKRQALRTLALPPAPVAQIEDFKSMNPLSQRIVQGRAAVIEEATNHEPELFAFLKSYFGGTPPQPLDEAFFDLIGTTC